MRICVLAAMSTLIVLEALNVDACSATQTKASQDMPFSGRWRMDTASLKGDIKPTIIQLDKGVFKKDGDEVAKADGRFHPVSGDGYIDETSITVVDDHVVREVDKIRGKIAYTVEYSVSADGNTLTWHVASYSSPSGQAVTSVTVQRRVGSQVEGVHPITGRWERVSVSVDAKSDWILALRGTCFSWRTEAGTGYDAEIGGRPVRVDGDSSGARALVTRPRADTVVETDISPRGVREAVLTMRLMPDHTTIRGIAFSPREKRSTTFILRRVAD